jgi:tricorn protease
MSRHLLAALFCAAVAAPASAQGTRLLRTPTVSDHQIAFVHANDIWVAPSEGGVAYRLTSDIGGESNPHFSADGQMIAFSGQYGGNTDVYVVPAAGGQPERLTWHPGADLVQGWTPEGDVLFQSARESAPTRVWKFYTVPLSGGLPEALPIPQAFAGELSADGQTLAFQELGFWDIEWRNYRGGQAQPISIVSMETFQRTTPEWEGERQVDPVWMDGVVYFLSERDWANNVWSYDPRTGETRQRTFHADFDAKSIDAGGGVVVYEQGGYLHVLDPATDQTTQMEIHVAGDQNWANVRWEDVPVRGLANARLSPTGKRALFEYRGDLFTVPAGEGSWRNITRSSGVADRSAAWSPDGSRIAWFSDEGGAYGLVIADQDGAHPRRIALANATFYYQPRWSPDGSKLAFTDTDYRVLIVDAESGELTHVDTDRFAHPERSMNPVWSPDSRWIAYARRMDTQLRAIFAHDTETGITSQLTDHMADSISPVWDASGDYLYFLASTDFGLNTGWLDMTSYDHPITRALYVAILKGDGASPFLPKSDEEAGNSQDDDEEEDSEEADEGSDHPVTIDFDGIASRILDAPGLPLRDYQGLTAGPEGIVFVSESVPNQPGVTLHRYEIGEAEASEFLTGVTTGTVSHDGKKMLVRTGANWSIVGTGGATAKTADGRLNLSGLRMQIDPGAEWAQMLADGWRFMRDYLYVDNTHGAPWDDVWDWYSPWLESVNHRSDLNYLLDMVSGEVAVGHSFVRGGDYPDLDNPRTGLLGVDLVAAGGGFRIKRLYSGESWTPGLQGPLAAPGMNVSEGDFLVAVDGQPLRSGDNPYRALEGTAGRTISIRVNDSPHMEGSRAVLVVPVANENQLRTWAWVEGNRRKVDELSGGRLAYVWLPNTGAGGYSNFNRMYFAQQDRQGAVIDERNNGGGSAADYFVDVMARELHGYFNSRAGDRKPWTQPMAGLYGPKVMIINGRAGSGGDLLPYFFRDYGIGPLIGTLTWGGLVGTWDTPPLIDGGRFVAPRGGFIDKDGNWAVEGEGVAPDIEVRNNPAEVIAGHDPQLERAVEEALRLLATEKVEFKPEPPAPIRYRRPVGNR